MAFRIDTGLPRQRWNGIVAELRDLKSASTTSQRFGDTIWAKTRTTPVLTVVRRDAIKYWVIGGWGFLQAYLRGQLAPAAVLAMEAAPATIHGDTFPAATFANRANALDDALGALPDYNYPAFRQAGYAAANVYANLIDPGDYVSAASYWAASRIKGAGAAGGGAGWGTTANTVYTLIHGAHGKMLGKLSDLDTEREVLFERGTVYRVEGIRTEMAAPTIVFVVVREVAAAPIGTATKDPYTGL